MGEGPVAAHPRRSRIAWARGNEVWEWSDRHGARAIAVLPLPVLALAWDHAGELWVLDEANLRSRAATYPAPGGELTVDAGGVGVVEAHWEDGFGPTSWIHRPDGAVDVRPGMHPAAHPAFVGTPDGRYLVARREGLRAIWELPR